MAALPDLAGAMAPSRKSRRRPLLRDLSSGPWHLKQLCERMGRTWSVKPGAAGADCRRAEATNRMARVERVRRMNKHRYEVRHLHVPDDCGSLSAGGPIVSCS